MASHHDDDDSGKFDHNTLGIPTEGFRSSHDAQEITGPPKFAEAAFESDGKTGKVISIPLNYEPTQSEGPKALAVEYRKKTKRGHHEKTVRILRGSTVGNLRGNDGESARCFASR